MSTLIIALTVLIFAIGLGILALASNYLHSAVIKAAKIIGIPSFIVGALLLSLVNTLPELSNNLMAAFKGVTELGVGNLIGAAFIDLTLAVGLIHLISDPEKIKKDNHNWMLLLLLIPIAIFLIFGLDNVINRFEGFLFIATYVTFQYFILQRGDADLPEWITARRLAIPYLMIPLAITSIIIGGFLVVDTSETLATLAGFPPAILGLTLIAFGTTLPETISGVISAIKKHGDIGISSAVGCIITDLGLIIGLIALIFTIKINYMFFLIPALMLAVAITIYYVYTELRKRTDRLLGFILIFLFVAYMTINLVRAF